MHQTISHYQILEPLGSGGAGHVWKAQDLRLKRSVAIKVLAPDLSRDDEAKKQFHSEAQKAAALAHPNIATVYEVIEAGDQSYIVMECVEGETVKSRIKRGPLSLNASLELAMQVADALTAAHARGLIHCDIKSANIMLTAEGRAKVLDFGLARIAAAAAGVPSFEENGKRPRRDGTGSVREPGSLQSSTVISGTPGYMSPEQIRGETLDERTDIFSLGVVLYEMLTARSPFSGCTPLDVLRSVLNDVPPSLSSVCDEAPLELESIVRRALAKGRDERYASAADLLSDLRALKHQLENRGGRLTSFVTDTVPASSLSDATSAERNRAESLRRVAWRYRRLLLAGCVLAAAAAVFNVISGEPGHREWAKSATLIILGAVFALGYAAARKTAPRAYHPMPSGAAFRGLLPFQEADRDRFYGRETDAVALFEMIRHSDSRFGVLFGESGCGKTSLLRAGLLPKLWEEGYVPVYCRSYIDPLAAALEECRKRSQVNSIQGEAPNGYLTRAARELGATIVIVCDQFEEFFISHKSREQREPFLSFIAACCDDSELPVRFLVSMRSDFLYLISSELGGRVAEPLISSRIYHLRNFDQEQAIKIIEKSAHRASLPFEEGLSRYVARDLTNGDVVSPSEMQIVGDQLQSKRIYTLQAYRRAGGKERLVHSFLEDVIQASGDADGARLLLRSLISDENTRVTLPLDEIARRTQRSAASVDRLLRLFVKSRLIREIQDQTPWRYELMHEYLIEKINQVTGSVMDATQRANRLLRQYLSDYSIDKRTRIPITRLWFIRRFSDIERGERERQFIKKSLQSGVVKVGAAAVLLAIASTLVAGALSVRNEWKGGVRLSDGHAAAVRRVVFSPDGSRLVTSGEDGRIIIWNFANRTRIATLDYCSMDLIASGYLPNGMGLAYSPDGKWIASAGEHDTVIVWDAIQFAKAAVLGGHGDQPSTISFSPDGKYLLTSSSGGNRTIIWEAGRWTKLRELPQATGAPSFLFSPDGSKFIFGESLSAWDLATGKQVTDGIDRDHYVARAAISHDGSRIVGLQSGTWARFYKTGDWAKGVKPEPIAVKEAHRYFARDVAFSPDGRMVATGSEDIALWDVETQTILARFEHTDNVWSLAFSRDGRLLVSTHGDGAILLWDITERRRFANFNEHSDTVMALRFSPDGKRLASAGKDQSLILWDAETGKKKATFTLNEFTSFKYGEGIININFSEDEKSLIDVSNVQVLLSDIASLRSRIVFNTDPREGEWVFAVSPDFRWIATNRAVYKFADGQRVAELDRELFDSDLSFNAMAFSPDGRWLLRASFSGKVYILDTRDWHLAAEEEIPDTRLGKVAFSPDSSSFVTGSIDGEVRLWQTMPLRQMGLLGKHQSIVLALAFSPDGSEVVSSGDDRTIALWDVERRKLKTYIGQQNASVTSLAISPDGQRLACGGQDSFVRIYTCSRTLWGYRLD